MNKHDLRIADYPAHILQAIDRIHHYTEDIAEPEFLENKMVQDAVIRNIEIIGEAARNIDRHHSGFSARHADVPWDDIYLMRNRVAHGYFTVDLEIVWETIQPKNRNSSHRVHRAHRGKADCVVLRASPDRWKS